MIFPLQRLYTAHTHTHTHTLSPLSVEAIYPVRDPMALQDRRVASLIQYAMKVEKTMFEAATSREEYYQLLVEKIYRIRKELEERRKVRKEMERRIKMGGRWHLYMYVTNQIIA